MPISFYPGNLQWLGLAKEVTYGTAIAAPTIWVPVEGPNTSRCTSLQPRSRIPVTWAVPLS